MIIAAMTAAAFVAGTLVSCHSVQAPVPPPVPPVYEVGK